MTLAVVKVDGAKRELCEEYTSSVVGDIAHEFPEAEITVTRVGRYMNYVRYTVTSEDGNYTYVNGGRVGIN